MSVPAVAAAPALVGRELELAALQHALNELHAGRGGFVLVTGEPGIGKTALVRHALAADRARAAWATCPSADVAPALWPWTVVLRQCADARLLDEAGDAGREVRLLLRNQAELAGPAPPTRFRLFDAVAQVLVQAADDDRLVVVLDDLHRADAGTVRLLQWVLETTTSLPVLVVAAYRDTDLEHSPLAAALADLVRYGTLLALEGLPVDALARLAQPLLEGRTAAEQAQVGHLLHEWAGGNPFFVHELVRLLEAEGRLHLTTSSARLPVPGGVRAVVARRLARLPQPTVTSLGWAAVAGREVQLDVLAAARDRPASEVLADLDPAVRAGLLVVMNGTRVAFAHDLVRETLLQSTGLHDRSARHWALGRVLAGAAGEDPERTAAAAAHLLAGVAAGDAAESVRWAELAAERSERVLAHEDAAAWYERALDAQRTRAAGNEHETRLLLRLGAARVAAGQAGHGREALLAAAALARARGDAERLAAAALGLGTGAVGFEVALFDQVQIDLLQEALTALPRDDSPVRAMVLARLSVALSFVDGTERRRELAEEALAVADRLGDGAVRAHALAAWCDVVSGPDDVDRRLEAAEEVVRLAASAGLRHLELLGLRLRVVGLLERGRLREASAAVTTYERGARALRQPLYDWYVPLWRSSLAMASGDLDAAARLNEQAGERGAAAGSENAQLLVTVQRFVRLRHEGRFAEASQLTGALLDEVPDHAAPEVLEPATLVADVVAGRLDRARRRADSLAAGLSSPARADSEWLPDTVQLGLVAVALQHRPLAAVVRDALRPYARLFAVEGIGAAVCGAVAAVLAQLCQVVATREEAEQWARLAERLHRDAGMVLPPPPLVAGRAPAQARPPVAQPDAAMRREGEVWALTWDGTTVRLRDSKGLRDLALLLRSPGRALHVTELTAVAASTSDADLDATAVRTYRRRLVELEDDLARADGDADLARASALRAERDAIAAELRHGLGLGGRRRRSGDPVERARKAVAARLRDSIARVRAAHPSLGRHLECSVRTGTWCSYEPERPVAWRG